MSLQTQEVNKAVDSPIQFDFITDHIATEEVASSDTQVLDVAEDELTIEPTADQTIISNAILNTTQPDATTIDTAQMTAGTQKPSVNPAYNLLLSQYSCPISALNLSQNESAQLYRVFLPKRQKSSNMPMYWCICLIPKKISNSCWRVQYI